MQAFGVCSVFSSLPVCLRVFSLSVLSLSHTVSPLFSFSASVYPVYCFVGELKLDCCCCFRSSDGHTENSLSF